jgi:hypothetical protein
MTLYVRQALTNRLIKRLYGSPEGLAGAWEAERADNPAFPEGRQRTTLYKWTANGVPSTGPNKQLIFGFCALLDVDPLSIFDYERNGYFSSFARIRRLIHWGASELGGLETLMQIYGPDEEWPSNTVANACYRRPWTAHQFDNRGRWDCKDYILLKARFEQRADIGPRAVHIAYRRTDTPTDTMWRYYGTVLAIDGMEHLYTESGRYASMPQPARGEIHFRTYFGGRQVEWRVASIHQFQLDNELPAPDPSVIGFIW